VEPAAGADHLLKRRNAAVLALLPAELVSDVVEYSHVALLSAWRQTAA
jgi:hypothetical protein